MNDLKNNENDNNANTVLRTVLNYLKTTRRSHYECDDTWYNCNAHPTNPGNNGDDNGVECICGADEWNKKLDEQIQLLEDALNGA